MSVKKLKHDAKMKARKAAKAAKKAKYLALAGTSRKSKRQHTGNGVSGTYKNAHIMDNCGNPGCSKCRGVGAAVLKVGRFGQLP